MTERNQFTPYGHNIYQQPTSAQPSYSAQRERIDLQRRNRGILDKVFGEQIAAKLRTPLVATVSLLAVGVAFAGIIAISYPGGSTAPENVPVIKAETTAFKTQPDQVGGMQVPFQDSTIFDITQREQPTSSIFDGSSPIENLLEPAPPEEEPVDISALADEITDTAAAFESEATGGIVSILDEAPSSPPPEMEETIEVLREAPKAVKTETVAVKQEKIAPQDIISEVDELAQTGDNTQRPNKLHAAGSSPETIAFVRSVLDQKDTKSASASATQSAQASSAQRAALAAAMNDVTPASGGDAVQIPSATPSAYAASGTYYVQLGSVTSRGGADSEWIKMGKSLPLSGLEYRVQEANLGERGTFYRIQAGPMSKDSANALCDSIKTQKPGGCLVVK